MRGLRILFVLCLAATAAWASPDTEGDLVKKARDNIRQAETELSQACQKYSEGYPDDGVKGLQQFMKLVEQAYAWLGETHRDPRKKPAGFKDMELKIRVFIRKLEDLKVSLPQDEREPVEKSIKRLHEIHDDLVMGLLNKPRKDE